MIRLRLLKLAVRPPDWDHLIEDFPNKNLFHESAWLDYILAGYPRTQIDYLAIRRGPEVVGYFCAIRTRKYGLSVWANQGSPYMCPLVDSRVDQSEIVDLLVASCKKEGIAHVALCNDWLNPDLMQAAGFAIESNVTHVCPLRGGVEAIWESMDGTCRTRIRKAEKSGLQVESTTDPTFVEEFYPRFVRLLALKGRNPSYDKESFRSLFYHLASADRLFALRVMNHGELIGTAFYPHDGRSMYYGDAAYEPDSLPLCPNNLLHWTAMKMAIERGIHLFNMGGGPRPSRFTEKFGGGLQPLITYRKSFLPLLDDAIKAKRYLHQKFAMASNLLRNFPVAQVTGGDEPPPP